MVHEHPFTSNLWDCRTDVDTTTALRLPEDYNNVKEISSCIEGLQQGIRAPLVPLNLPTIQPLIGSTPIDTFDANHPLEAHVQRQVMNANQFVGAMRTSTFQGESHHTIPGQLR